MQHGCWQYGNQAVPLFAAEIIGQLIRMGLLNEISLQSLTNDKLSM